MKLGYPNKLEIRPNAEKTEFVFRLHFDESPRSVEFVLTRKGAMRVMRGLQILQIHHKIPIPPPPRSPGKPKLRAVKEDDE
jgi:hypothetical protein